MLHATLSATARTLSASTRTDHTSLTGTTIDVDLCEPGSHLLLGSARIDMPGCLDTDRTHLEAIEIACRDNGVAFTGVHYDGASALMDDGLAATVELA